MSLTAEDASKRVTYSENRPFYFSVVLWGEQYRRYFLDYCIGSLLSPANIPSLSPARHNKFLVATYREDWQAMSQTATFLQLSKYLTPEFLELPRAISDSPDNEGIASNLRLMNRGYALAGEMAFRDRAYVVFLTPDSMLSDGSVSALETQARNGIELVLCTALRLGQEPFFRNLEKLGLRPDQSETSLQITGRQMVAAVLDGMHSETLTYEWDAPYFFPRGPAAVWWRVPEKDGMLIHALNWMPLLFDFGAISKHDRKALEGWTLDGDYVYHHLGNSPAIHVVQDSDEIFMASWAPLSDRPREISRQWFKPLKGLVQLRRGVEFRDFFYSDRYDPLKRQIFFLPVFWHVDEIGATWATAEDCAQNVLRRYLLPAPGSEGNRIKRCAWAIVLVAVRIWIVMDDVYTHRAFVAKRFQQMISGDRDAWRRVRNRVWAMLKQIFA